MRPGKDEPMTIETPAFLLAQGAQPVQEADDLGEILAEEIQSEVGAQPDPHGPGMPQLDFADYPPQLVWLAITFVALYLLMSRVALPRIATVIESRRDRIAHDLDTAARLREETDEVVAAYEQELAEARGRAFDIATETRNRLNAELAAERAKVEAEIAERVGAAEAAISKARDAALGEVDVAAAEVTGEIVERLIGTRPSDRDVAAALAAVREG